MPDIATGSLSIAFGDFRRGYLIVDRQGVRVLRDPFTAKPYVLFYTTKRVGGGVQDFDAIKLLKFSVSRRRRAQHTPRRPRQRVRPLAGPMTGSGGDP
jgi:predicted phage gp36 major capsid-like protein